MILFSKNKLLGSLAYVKAPVLEKNLSDLQTALHNGSAVITNDVYNKIAQEVFQIIECCKKMKLM